MPTQMFLLWLPARRSNAVIREACNDVTTDNSTVMVACVCNFAAPRDRMFYEANIKTRDFWEVLNVGGDLGYRTTTGVRFRH